MLLRGLTALAPRIAPAEADIPALEGHAVLANRSPVGPYDAEGEVHVEMGGVGRRVPRLQSLELPDSTVLREMSPLLEAQCR